MATLAVREVKDRTGLHRDTILRYIREGKIQATLQPTSSGFEEYRVDESELAKLPKPYKKRNQPRESEVPQGTNFTASLPLVEVQVVRFKGSQEQAREFYRTLQTVG